LGIFIRQSSEAANQKPAEANDFCTKSSDGELARVVPVCSWSASAHDSTMEILNWISDDRYPPPNSSKCKILAYIFFEWKILG